MNKPQKVALIVPCYNEESIINDSVAQLVNKLNELIEQNLATDDSFILLVNDGSSDQTWPMICDLHQKYHDMVCGLKLSANCGHQKALFAGLMYGKDHADAIISLDADLQDDINVLNKFLEEFYQGNDIVYGVRSDRSSDSFFKRFTAEAFYRLMNYMGAKTINNHADFRLMSRRAVEALAQYHEVNLYLRGLIPMLGYRQSIVFYVRKKANRPTHYPLVKMLFLAWDGITSFSVKPIRLISGIGILTLLLSMVLIIHFLYVKLFGFTVSGWTSLIMTILFFGGIQLLSIGVIGEYIAKTYVEVKRRPRYNIEETTRECDNDKEI